MLRVGRSSGLQGACRRCLSSISSVDSPITPEPPAAAARPLRKLHIQKEEVLILQERLEYKFRQWAGLQDALTHPSYPKRPRSPGPLDLVDPPARRSYKTLIPRGMLTLQSSLAIHMSFLTPPDQDPDDICHLNLSPYKLARTALRLGLYEFLRHDSPKLDMKVNEFIKVQEGKIPYRGIPVKVPDVLPGMVVALFGAITVDHDYDAGDASQASQSLAWPLILWEDLSEALRTLRYLCQNFNMKLDFKTMKFGNLFTTRVFINKNLHGSGSSEMEASAQLIAAMDALNKLPNHMLKGTILENTLMASSQSQVNEKEKRTLNATWTSDQEGVYIDVLVEKVKRGEMTTWTSLKQIWEDIMKEFVQQSGTTYDLIQIKNRYNKLRQRYKNFKGLINHTGGGYDPNTFNVTADDETWDDYIKINPDAKHFRIKGCPEYPKLCVIFGDTTETGSKA